MQLKHPQMMKSQNPKSIQPTSPKLFISFEGPWLSAAITSLILTGPCETRRPNDWRSFPAPLALWLHEALPSFQDSSLCRERVPLGRALWGNSFFFVDKCPKMREVFPKNILLNLRKLYIQKFSGGPSFTAQQVW